jgi:hypothetical protein
MPIIGCTVGEDGKPILRLPVVRKIACGIGPSGQRNHPERLFKFIFMTRGPAKEWVIDPEAMARYNPNCKHAEITDQCDECCTKVKVKLISDPISDGKGNLDFENILRTSLTWWGRTGWKCRGDGVNAIRRTEDFPEGKPWTPCRIIGCPDWENDTCGASGDLYCVLSDENPSGGISRIHTSSEWSIGNLHSALLNICTYTRNHLAGAVITLKVTKEKATPTDKRTGKPMETWVPILSVDGSMEQILADSRESMKLYESFSEMFGGRVLTPFEEEVDLAKEIPPEFPRGQEQKALPETTTQATAPESKPEPPKPPAEPPKPPEPENKPEPEKKNYTVTGTPVYEGLVKSVKEFVAAKDPQKRTLWKAKIEVNPGQPNASEAEIRVLDEKLVEILNDAQRRSQEVQVPCEIRTQEKSNTIVATKVDFLSKRTSGEAQNEVPWWAEKDDFVPQRA